jgi:hypothetical protein
LFEDRYSLSEICRRVGWGRGGTLRLANPTWRGVRAYPASDERDAFEVALPLKPLLTPEKWALAQSLLANHRTWSKETRNQRHLAAGLLLCHCGRNYYTHCDTRPKQFDEYYCGSRIHGGPGCGAARLRRPIVDATIIRIVGEYLTDAKFLSAVFRRLKDTPQVDTRAERERELAKLVGRRKKWIEQYDEDRITRAEFQQKMDAVEKATREIEAAMPLAPPPSPDYRVVVAGIVETFAAFGTLPFPDQRATLKRVVRRFHVVDNAFTEVGVSGAFMAELAHTNSAQRRVAHRMPRPDRLGWHA